MQDWRARSGPTPLRSGDNKTGVNGDWRARSGPTPLRYGDKKDRREQRLQAHPPRSLCSRTPSEEGVVSIRAEEIIKRRSDGENTIPPYGARPARTDARAARTGVKQERREQGNNVARIELCGRILYNPFPSLKHKNFRQFRKLILPYLIIALLPNYVATCL